MRIAFILVLTDLWLFYYSLGFFMCVYFHLLTSERINNKLQYYEGKNKYV